MESYWSEANGHAPHSVKYESEAAVSSFPYCTESSLNFSTSATAYSEDDAEYATGRRNKTSRQDPLSHRIIEKRRRDRMNSCLADLSRLIPPQYQRKGRGRIEKTEIIEMAIRHLKHLQSECIQKENEYRMGYTDCMKEAAKFLYESHMEEFCYRLVARLQEHCVELMKNDCYKSRNCHIPDNVSASSGSPHQAYHTAPPLCQLRDMLGNSDIEQSNDHNDVKDLSFRNHLNQLQRNAAVAAAAAAVANSTNNSAAHEHNSSGSQNNAASNSTTSSTNATLNNATSTATALPNGGGVVVSGAPAGNSPQRPHQAPVITSTGPATLNHHNESSNHDFESSSREPLLHTDTSNMHSPPPRDSLLNHHAHLNLHQHTTDSLQSARMRNFSESSHDIEHNNNYKYKNHIKERFNHELHDEETSSEHCPAPPLLQSEHSHTHSLSEHSKDGTEPEIAPIMAKKRKLAEAVGGVNSNSALEDCDTRPLPSVRTPTTTTTSMLGARDEKPFSFADIKTELSAPAGLLGAKTLLSTPSSTTHVPPNMHAARSFAVPIFALHGQGTYYVPLNVDYNVLVPFLNGADLLEKNYTSMPVVHPININVNFMPTTSSSTFLAAAAAAAAVAAGKQQLPPVNGTVSSTAAATATAVTKAKLESISNGW
ncbi:transcription factor cwo [Anastrepha obliqua]|uniref:transcription factor cwo n=1 Tax=Anastrepha obliqua TaxID=95512 RepID=UPI00240919A0|nr:transcription factor cwo [Anastrepha obliqua]XP_054725855.1 transcription factor cwo [Anastrepha obliqua]